MQKFAKWSVAAAFALILAGFLALHIISTDIDISTSERRHLAQLPKLSLQRVFSSEFSDELEGYMLDQFPARDPFRALNAAVRLYVLGASDVNGLYITDSYISKLDARLDEDQVSAFIAKLNSITADHLDNSFLYYSVIPDKAYFTAEASGRPHMDYSALMNMLSRGIDGPQYIDIFDTLDISDYYYTDTHWRSEQLFDTAKVLAAGMGAPEIPAQTEYTAHWLDGFTGVYASQLGLSVKPDRLCYLTSAYTDASSVKSVESDRTMPVYTVDKFHGIDGYDVFLSGAGSLLEIECGNAQSERELIIFRDSFGSSVAPLFIGAYSRITLIDLRYFSSTLLSDYVDFNGKDVLFLYSTSLINSGMLLK